MRRPLSLLTLLLACAGCQSWHETTATSSLQFRPGEQQTLRLRHPARERGAVRLAGQGNCAIAFDAHTPTGAPMASGVLGAGSAASCDTSEGEIDVDFTAGPEGGTVAFEVYTTDGLSIEIVRHKQ